MCGIAGIINFKNEEKHSINLKEMANALKHRGPDDEGFMLFSKKPTIFFGNDFGRSD
jgi:asparagine synthase (glutamine-hydrolysing)